MLENKPEVQVKPSQRNICFDLGKTFQIDFVLRLKINIGKKKHQQANGGDGQGVDAYLFIYQKGVEK